GYYLGSVASHDMVVLGNVLRRSLRNSQPGLSGWNEESAAGLQHAAVAGRSGGPEVVVRQQLRTRRNRLHFGTGTKGDRVGALTIAFDTIIVGTLPVRPAVYGIYFGPSHSSWGAAGLDWTVAAASTSSAEGLR